MCASVIDTRLDADVALYIDYDQRDMYSELIGTGVASTIVGERIGPCAALNSIWRANPGYAAYGAATDDSLFLTPGWDAWVVRTSLSAPGKVTALCPYHADESEIFDPRGATMTRRSVADFRRHGFSSGRMDFPWVSAAWADAVGWFACPDTYHAYWDVVLEVMGEMTHIAYAREDEFAMRHAPMASLNDGHLDGDARSAILTLAFGGKSAVERLRAAMAAGRPGMFVDSGQRTP